jgi:predicted small lipoprotein YifL
MNTSLKRVILASLVVAALLAVTACGGSTPTPSQSQPNATSAPANATSAPAKATAAPTKGSASAPTSTPSAPSMDAQTRISDSASRLLLDDNPAFKSFHIEASGTDPSWDQQSKKVINQGFTLKADKSGEDLYLLYTTEKSGNQAATKTEGYSIKGGLGGTDGTGKEYLLEAGKLTESLGAISMTWVFFPFKVVLPMAFAALGPSAQGSEAVDGRQADKFAIDTANAPAGVLGAMGSFLSVTSAKGTVWIDKETGALLKCSLDYTQDLVDSPGSQTVAGKGSGHIELVVTKVNNTSVTLPK